MNDKDIELIIYNQLVTELKNHGITTGVKAGFFPENHISGEDFIAFYPVGETPAGWQKRSYAVRGQNANHTESQITEKKYRVQGFITESQTHTAGDIVAAVRMIVNSLPFTEALNKQGAGVQRAGAIRVLYLADDQGHYRQAPSFDFNVTFTRTLRPETGVVSALFPDIYCI